MKPLDRFCVICGVVIEATRSDPLAICCKNCNFDDSVAENLAGWCTEKNKTKDDVIVMCICNRLLLLGTQYE